MSDRMPNRMPEYMSDIMPDRMPDRMSECMPDRMSLGGDHSKLGQPWCTMLIYLKYFIVFFFPRLIDKMY